MSDTPPSLEQRLAAALREVPELTFGYTGNFQDGGDDRNLYIWVKGQFYPDGSGQLNLWSWPATQLDRPAYATAMQAIENFTLGLKVARDLAKGSAANT
jgi:hypothetical protein